MATANLSHPLVAVQADPFLNLLQVILDPDTPADMIAAFQDFMAHDVPEFAPWLACQRVAAAGLYPARVVRFEAAEGLRAQLPEADLVVVEDTAIGAVELDLAPRLKVVQRFGQSLRMIDVDACRARGIEVLTIRRRANMACAELVFALILSLARRLLNFANRLSTTALAAKGLSYRAYDRRYTPGANYGRIPGLRRLNGTTIGIIGLGEIGQEVALRAAAFDMRILYHQRTRQPAQRERELAARYAQLPELLADSDWVVLQIPGSPATEGFMDAAKLAQMKPGACLINVSRPQLVDREAAIAALRSGHLGGLGLDPPYDVPGRPDDELLAFENVVITPHFGGSPRFNALDDFAEIVTGMAHAWNRSRATPMPP